MEGSGFPSECRIFDWKYSERSTRIGTYGTSYRSRAYQPRYLAEDPSSKSRIASSSLKEGIKRKEQGRHTNSGSGTPWLRSGSAHVIRWNIGTTSRSRTPRGQAKMSCDCEADYLAMSSSNVKLNIVRRLQDICALYRCV